MIISFCFTIKLMSDPSKLENYRDMICKSVDCAKQHHSIKFYTDEKTLPFLKDIDVDKVIVNTEGFYFVDDFKVHLLSIIGEEEVLVDTDLFLFSPLKLEDGHDIYVDFRDESSKYWYKESLNYFIENGIMEIIPNFIQPIVYVPNIGILKIKNKILQKEYINIYYKVKEWVLTKDKHVTKGISIILGQYLLGLILQNEEYSPYYCYNSKNSYLHFSGPKKFREGILSNIRPIKRQNLV